MDTEKHLLHGASKFHTGIDVAATPGSNLVAIMDGKIIYTAFNGANGFTVKLQNNDFVITYSHVSPNFLVSVGDFVKQGEIIAQVGPKYVDSVPNNPYKDSSGRTTNGATTGAHLHFSIKKGNEYVNPLDYLTKQD